MASALGEGVLDRGRWHARAVRRARAYSVAWIQTITLVIIVAIWSAVLLRIEFEQQKARDAAVVASEQLASAFAQHIDSAVHNADAVTRWVKYEYERSPSTFDLGAYRGRGLIPTETALQVALVDTNGNVMQTTSDVGQGEPVDRDHYLIHQASAGGGLYISPPTVAPLSKRWTLQFARRLNHADGSFAGMVVVSEEPDFLTSGFYNLEALGPEGMLAVVSDDGYLLSRRAGGEQMWRAWLPASAFGQMVGAKGGVYEGVVDHVRRFVTYRHLSHFPIAVLVGLSEQDMLADYRHGRTLYIAMVALVSALLLLAAGLLTLMIGKLRDLAETDSLTGIPNRYLLTETLHQRMDMLGASARLAILYIDLDNFKKINDTLGHKAGDELLLKVAHRLDDLAGDGRLIARIGGDEFVILVEDGDAAMMAGTFAKSLITAFDRPFVMRGNSYLIHVSIGIAVHTKADDSEFDLLTRADLAMYAAKEAGKGTSVSQYCMYTPTLSERALRDIERHQELQSAITNREFFLEYQPIVTLDGELQGVEALVRWRHPEKGVLPPATFVPFAESSGLIVQIGEFVLEEACQEFRTWQDADPRPLTLSINVSPIQLTTGDVVHAVTRCLNRYMIEPERLRLEVTETVVLDESALVRSRLEALRGAGVKIVLDDFGTGYSSLSNLINLSIDGVKVDRNFTNGVPDRKAATATLTHLVGLTRELGLSMVIEGVETSQQVAWLSRFGDVMVQGFYFSMPVPAAALAVSRTA